jgi:hypothetical protein
MFRPVAFTAFALAISSTALADDTAAQFDNPSPIDFTQPFLYDAVTPLEAKPNMRVMPAEPKLRPPVYRTYPVIPEVRIIDRKSLEENGSPAVREFLERLDRDAESSKAPAEDKAP